MKTYQWTLKDGSLRIFRDKQLETIIGGWDSDTGRIFEIRGKSHDDNGTPIQRTEVEIGVGFDKKFALDYFKNVGSLI
jgi:hypothetical protein